MPVVLPVTLAGTPTSYWRELDDSSYTAAFRSEGAFTSCCVTVEFIGSGTGITKTLNLPVYPEDVTNAITTNYSSYDILGRPGQISAYTSTSDITTSFSLHMHRELKTYNNDIAADRNHIDDIVSLIEAAQYPLFKPGTGEYAPIVTYKFGDTLICGKQTSVNTKWSGPKIEGKFMEVVVSISVTNLFDRICDYTDIVSSSPRGWGRFKQILI